MQAAVAIILRDGSAGTEFLLMQRAQHPQDPWSGQMSFPGGKIEIDDGSPMSAAIRETQEEVGVTLSPDDCVGQLDDLYGLKVDGQYSVHVSTFVFKPKHDLQPKGNHEVADLVWLPFAWLQDQTNAYEYYHPHSKSKRMPAVLIDEQKNQVLWGLSLRMVSILFELLNEALPVLSVSDQVQLNQIHEQELNSKEFSDLKQTQSNSRGG